MRNIVNDLDLDALGEVVEAIQADPAKARVGSSTSPPAGPARPAAKAVDGDHLGRRDDRPQFKIVADEPCNCSAATARPTRRSC
jgi:hypothetical protein